MKIKHLILSLLFLTLCTIKTQANEENVIYEYKQYEKFDLGNLEIEGKIISPGDLSIQRRSRNDFSRNLFNRKNFNDFINNEIKKSY